jgi:hypothetical protein
MRAKTTSPDWHNWQTRCAPQFVETIKGLAKRSGKTPDDVYRLWKQYERQCEWSDQSPLLGEFQEWYKDDLKPAEGGAQ